MENKLGITEGEWEYKIVSGKNRCRIEVHVEKTVIYSSLISEDNCNNPNCKCRGEDDCNAKLIADAGTTANKCNKLPSQLLQEHEEMKAMLEKVLKECAVELYYEKEIQHLLTKIDGNG